VNSAIKLLFKITSLFLYRMESLFGGDDVVLVMATGGYESFLGGLVVDSDDSDAESDSDDPQDDPQDNDPIDPAELESDNTDDSADSEANDSADDAVDKKKKKKTKKDMQESTTDEHPNPDITEQDSDEPPLNEELMSDDDEPFGKPSLEDEIVDVAEDAAEALGGDDETAEPVEALGGGDEAGSDRALGGGDEAGSDRALDGDDETATGGETELFGGSEFVGAEEGEAAELIEQFGGSDLVVFGGEGSPDDELTAAVSTNSQLVEAITGQSIRTDRSLEDEMKALREDDPTAATEEQVAELSQEVEKQHGILNNLFGKPDGTVADEASDSDIKIEDGWSVDSSLASIGDSSASMGNSRLTGMADSMSDSYASGIANMGDSVVIDPTGQTMTDSRVLDMTASQTAENAESGMGDSKASVQEATEEAAKVAGLKPNSLAAQLEEADSDSDDEEVVQGGGASKFGGALKHYTI
jgi:hypothetical protein